MEKYQPNFVLSEVKTSQSQLGLIFEIFFKTKLGGDLRGRLLIILPSQLMPLLLIVNRR